MKYFQTSYKLPVAQNIGITSTASVISTVMGTYTETIRIVGNVDSWFNQGSSTVTASSTGDGLSKFLPAGVPEYVNRNGFYIAALANSSSGIFNVAECTQ